MLHAILLLLYLYKTIESNKPIVWMDPSIAYGLMIK